MAGQILAIKKRQFIFEPPFGGDGAGERTRTVDSHLGKVALYQLSYARIL